MEKFFKELVLFVGAIAYTTFWIWFPFTITKSPISTWDYVFINASYILLFVVGCRLWKFWWQEVKGK